MLRPSFLHFCCLILFAGELQAETIEGFAEPYREVELAVGDSGILASVSVEEGDRVDAGQRLVTLDNRVLEASLSIARKKASSTSNVEVARAEYQLYSQRLQRVRILRQRGHATQSEMTRAEADTKIAEARLRHASDENTLSALDCKRIEAQIAQRQIMSPFSGVVTGLHRKEGEPTLVTDPRIVTLAQLNKLRVKFPATPAQVAVLKEEQSVKLQLADSKELIDAKIERIAQTIDAKSGTLELQVVINNENQAIRSGARCLLDIDVGYAQSDTSQGAHEVDTATKPVSNSVSKKTGLFGFGD